MLCRLSSIFVLLLSAGCSKEPDPTYSEPLVQSAYERADLIKQHAAKPVKVDGYGHVFVAGPETERSACSRCHVPDAPPYREDSDSAGRDAHWDIEVYHAGEMECFSCHMQEDPNQLVSVIDRDVTLETSYLHCGSCHKDELASWLGGGHGKRLTGWHGVRIVQNCTGCHNPHSPARGTVMPVAQPMNTPERAKRH